MASKLTKKLLNGDVSTDIIKSEIKQLKNNTGSVRGNLKNAWKVSKLAPTPESKIIVFLIVFLVPVILGFFIILAFLIISSGAMVSVLAHDPEVVKKFTGDGGGAASADSQSRVNIAVPENVKGKFLLTWNLEKVTSVQSSYRAATNGAHRAMDFQPVVRDGSPYHMAIYPIAPGTVVFASTGGTATKIAKTYQANTYGNVVLIKHDINGDNYYSLYAHLNRVDVKEGDVVSFNNRIGLMGCTGRSIGSGSGSLLGCGAHLHLEIRGPAYYKGGDESNPSSYSYTSGELKVGDYITCGDNGETLGNTTGDKSRCIKYTEKVLGVSKPDV